MKITTVTCDTCQRDISSTNNVQEYRILLRDESMPHQGRHGTVTDMNPTEWIGNDRHFCSGKCLREWVLKNC